ncbi:MAG: dockerin type I repeat-containing protein, partial [Oscillospiraceae bacterium]|nr:dockerin type I repeat-containing protein [Oscillospiraceae bacterium]
INDNPDPYLYNYFYNFNSTKSAGSTWDAEDYSAWNATPYTLIGASSSTITITIDGVTKTCSPYFFYEPDVHIVFMQNPANVLAAYQETYNADYEPLFLSTVSTSSARSDGLGNAYNMFEMSTNLTDIGAAVDELAAELGKTTRYAESATEIGSNYDKWCRGFYYWAQLMFEVNTGTLTDEEIAALESYGVDMDALGGGLQKVRGVRAASYDEDTDSWTISTKTARTTQYADGIVEDVYDVLTAEIAAGERDDYILTTDELIEYLKPEGQEYGGFLLNVAASSFGSQATLTLSGEMIERLETAGVKILTNLPTTEGMIAQARANALGQPYYLGFIYYDQLSAMTNVDMTLNPISLVFYWMERFYHVSDTDAMQTVIVNMLESADLPAGLVVNDSATTDNFGSGAEESIENMIILGMKYYLAVEEPRLEAAGEEMTVGTDSEGLTTSADTNWAYWFSLNGEGYEDILGMGIGSDDIYLNPEGNGEANRNLNAQKWASDGTVETFYTEYSSYIKDGTVTTTDMTYGDVNGDGSIDLSDVLIVLRSVAKALTLTDTQATYADVTNDGSVGVADAVLLLQYIAADGEGITLGPSTSGGGGFQH